MIRYNRTLISEWKNIIEAVPSHCKAMKVRLIIEIQLQFIQIVLEAISSWFLIAETVRIKIIRIRKHWYSLKEVINLSPICSLSIGNLRRWGKFTFHCIFFSYNVRIIILFIVLPRISFYCTHKAFSRDSGSCYTHRSRATIRVYYSRAMDPQFYVFINPQPREWENVECEHCVRLTPLYTRSSL